MTDDLITWTRARIAEKRQRAESAAGRAPSPWSPRGSRLLSYANGNSEDMAVVATYHDKEIASGYGWDRIFIKADRSEVVATHIAAASDPRVVIAECDAHTLILDLHEHQRPYPNRAPDEIGCVICDVSQLDGGLNTSPNGWCGTVRAVAWAYRYNDGFREEWRP